MKEWLHSHEKAAYRIVNAALLICMVLLGAENFLGIHRLGAAHFFVAFAVIGVLTGICYMTVRGRILCLSALFILSCAWIAAGPAGNLDFWRHFFRWLVGREEAVREWEAAFGLLQTAMLATACYPREAAEAERGNGGDPSPCPGILPGDPPGMESFRNGSYDLLFPSDLGGTGTEALGKEADGGERCSGAYFLDISFCGTVPFVSDDCACPGEAL